jgi:hypothetical protein
MALTADREVLHNLIDGLPDRVLEDAARYLKALSTDDPVRRAVLLAPEDDEPETEEERRAVQEAREDFAAGRVVSHAEVLRLLGEP